MLLDQIISIFDHKTTRFYKFRNDFHEEKNEIYNYKIIKWHFYVFLLKNCAKLQNVFMKNRAKSGNHTI